MQIFAQALKLVGCFTNSIFKLKTLYIEQHLRGGRVNRTPPPPTFVYFRHNSSDWFCNDILQTIDEGQEVVLVLLDLSSAFDTIDHKVLLDRLRIRYSFSEIVLDWFRSYLSNRTQSVKIGKDLSAESWDLSCSLYFSPLLKTY